MTARRPVYLVALVLLLIAGVYLRLNQYLDQILLDDEWHAVHQLLAGKRPADLFLTFGQADFSIPLGIFYWLEARWFGLSEFAMRWPMLLTGLATLVVFPCYVWRRFSPRVALIFTFFLALSPMLVIYSHTARPYALTLFLSFLGLYAFYRYLEGAGQTLLWGTVYCISAAIAIWLHPITGPFMASPFLLEGIRGLVLKRSGELAKLLRLAVPAAVLVAALVLPPVFTDLQGLALKAGEAKIGWATLYGAWFMWLGTPSLTCVAALFALSVLGFREVLKTDRLWQSATVGLGLTIAAILVTQPAWVNHSVTFGRYLLPAIPLLLLAAACGVDALLRWNRLLKWPFITLWAALAGMYVIHSPIWEMLARPNSNMNHSRFQFDFRPEHNGMARYQDENLILSPFWESLSDEPPNTQLIAVAPFYFETYNWDGPRWEQLGGQRVLPAYLVGFCVEHRNGEVPRNEQYQFRNVFYLTDLNSPTARQPDWLIYTKPLARFQGSVEGRRIAREANGCIRKLQAALGAPDYEDDTLLAFKLSGRSSNPYIARRRTKNG